MIGKLRGIIDSIYENYTILDVNGVGYKVFCSSKTLSEIQNIQSKISLIIETIVREDSINLYGFLNENEREWFNQLCKVSGVGSKMALKVMSALSINEIIDAINSGDKKAFCRASGVGTRLATRIITELKNTVSKINIDLNTSINNNKNIENISSSILNDAISALENLGYQRSIIHKILITIIQDRGDITLESLITEALKKINNF
jgi:Holliday junction DNA helicase RuvA